MQNLKTLVSLPGWAEAYNEGRGSANKIENVRAAYARVPLIFRAARIRANAIRKLPVHFRKIGAEEDSEFPFDIDLADLLWRSEMALCFRGGATWLKKRASLSELGIEVSQGLAWLNPFTVKIEYNNKARQFTQEIGVKRFPQTGFWTDDDILFIREFSFDDDVTWGIAPADVALGSAQLSFYLRRVASVFFEHGAMPVTLAQISGLSNNPEDPANKRVSDFLRRATAGIGNFARILGISGEVKMSTTQSPLKDMVIPELKEDARKDIALAFEIPVTLLDDDANYATASEHKRGFYDETVIPRADMLAEEINRQWLNPLGYEIQFAPEEMDLYQADESDRAVSLGQLVSAINTDPQIAQFAMGVLGYDLSEEQQAELDAMIADKQARAEQAAQRLAQQPTQPMQFGGNGNGDQQAKSIEVAQFRRYLAKHKGNKKKIAAFLFKYLTEPEQKALIAEAQPSETGKPFQVH